jgi:N-methylhydantoinase A
MSTYRVGVDIGGTFTDLVYLGSDGKVLARKIASTPDDYSRAVLEGIKLGILELKISPDQVSEVGHGFTVASNAIIEGRGAKTALITTEGFRDVLEFGRNRIPRLYDLYYEKPRILVKRQNRLEVRERMSYKGEVLRPLNKEDVDKVVDRILNSGIKSIAISLLHSYANPDHEEYIAKVIRERAPNIILTVSSELLPEMKEYERTSTTVINSYVRPVVETYLTHLADGLKGMGVTVPLVVMQSNGGLATTQIAKEKPVYCIESGPAAGVVGAFQLGKRLGIDNMLTLDMGGTTAKASMIEDGQMLLAPEYEVGGDISVGHRLLKGAGHILRVPAIDLAEVGAGGGSIASVDKSGSIRVGPNSSGAVPGPACYNNGGSDATVTDADVILGYLNPKYLLGGAFPIERDKASKAVTDQLANPLNLSEIEAAHAIHLVVNSNMGRALRAVSSERGRDPRRFVLVAFGGGGPVHAAGMAEMLDIKKVIIPPFPGVFSSFGLLYADVEHHFVKTYFKTFQELDIDALNVILEGFWGEGQSQLRDEGFADDSHEVVTQVDMKYVGQVSELTVYLPPGRVTPVNLKKLSDSFEEEHERTYGYRTDDPFQLVNLRVIARGLSKENRIPDQLEIPLEANSVPTERPVYFGPSHGFIDAPVKTRASLEGNSWSGPLIIEEYDSTTVVPPGWTVTINKWRDVVMDQQG